MFCFRFQSVKVVGVCSLTTDHCSLTPVLLLLRRSRRAALGALGPIL
jgi:hypothetical protein